MMKDYTYIAIQSGGYYGDACKQNGWLQAGQSCVIEYKQFTDFMNYRKVTQPMFVSDSYSACVQVAKELNESARLAQEGKLQDETV